MLKAVRDLTEKFFVTVEAPITLHCHACSAFDYEFANGSWSSVEFGASLERLAYIGALVRKIVRGEYVRYCRVKSVEIWMIPDKANGRCRLTGDWSNDGHAFTEFDAWDENSDFGEWAILHPSPRRWP
jgi:hypothetical protein